MKYKAHLIGGMLSGVLIAGNLSVIDTAIVVASASVGGLLPDIDHTGSYLGSKVKPISKMINSVFGHRGATHSPLLISTLFLFLHIVTDISVPIFIGLMAGALSHVLLDAMTVSGVPMFYPFSKAKVSLLPLRTGGAGEHFVSALMLAGIALLTMQRFTS